MSRRKVFMLSLYRRKYGFTQRSFSELCGISYENYKKKENGKIPFSWEEVQRIRDILIEHAAQNNDPALTSDDIFLLI